MGFKKEVKPLLHETYSSSLIDWMKEHAFRLNVEPLTFYLAEEFGFCYGVDRAVELAYESRKMFADKKIFLTSEIIHNPRVNAVLREKGIEFLSLNNEKLVEDNFKQIQSDDVVIIPAFGTTTQELDKLRDIGCTLVDTTCGSVMNVWKRVSRYGKDGFTAVVHGKYDHEETRATCSRVTQYTHGQYLVVRDLEQARYVCRFILGEINKETLLSYFSKEALSPNFDPDRDLKKIGCANQTTMLSSDSIEIADRIQEAMVKRYGRENIDQHFRHFDTICSATQERQDAVRKLIEQKMDLYLVIGGFNSSNTGHLVEMASEYGPAFHIQDPSDVISKDEIRHKLPYVKDIHITRDWLPKGRVKIGVTAGASSPNRVIEEVMKRVIEAAELRMPPFVSTALSEGKS